MAGGSIELSGLTKKFGEIAVDNIDLTVASGEFFSLLGPSGCGKTTTLRLIAGFEQPTSGKILLDGADVSDVPPHRRNVNTVFQSYALFPFLDVRDNVAFGLRHRGVGKADLKRRVDEALDLVKMTSFAKRRPGQLSGGQQQRVALARALVLNPAVLLLDEPLGALDAKLRRSLKVELKALQERIGITFLYVTHDQEEALTMSDRLAVMNAGRIVQIGTPRQVYEEPADTYVADFLGAANLMEIDVVTAGAPGALRLGDWALTSQRCEAHRGGPRARGDQAGAGADRGAWFGRREPGACHGGARGVPRRGHPGDAAAGAGHLAAGADAERRRAARTDAGHPGALLPAAGRAAGAGRLGAGGSGACGRAAGGELGLRRPGFRGCRRRTGRKARPRPRR